MSGIEVQIRLKPCAQSAWTASETVLFRHDTRFVFNHVHGQQVSNQSLFQSIEPFVNAAYTGQNVTVMAYGQTGSGKTHSMLGTDTDHGFIPRAAETLIKLAANNGDVTLTGSCIEVYNETIRDLLAVEREVVLYETNHQTSIDRTHCPIAAMSDYRMMSARAENSRKYGATDMNEHSSRSHTILSFELSRRSTGTKSVLNFVDLAGSESAAKSNTVGHQLREGGFINKSLLALGNVVDAIVDGRGHIPYRESKLTRVLRSCLGGRSLAYILTCINPSYDNIGETTAALRFAQRAMKIKNDPTVVLNAPPLLSFHLHRQLTEYASSIESMEHVALQMGIYDTYTYCDSVAAEILTHSTETVETAAHEMFAVNVALLGSEKRAALDKIGDVEQSLSKRAHLLHHAENSVAAEQRRVKEAEQKCITIEKKIEDCQRRVLADRESREREERLLEAHLNEEAARQVSPETELELFELEARMALQMEERQLAYALFEEFCEFLPPLDPQYEHLSVAQLLKNFRDEVKRKIDETAELEAAQKLALEGLDDFGILECPPERQLFDTDAPQQSHPTPCMTPSRSPSIVVQDRRRKESRQVARSRRQGQNSVAASASSTPTHQRAQPQTPQPSSRAAAAKHAASSPGGIIKSTLAQIREVQSRYWPSFGSPKPQHTPGRKLSHADPNQTDVAGEVDINAVVGIAQRRRMERELSEQRGTSFDSPSPAATAMKRRRSRIAPHY